MVDRAELRKFIIQFFSDLELEELCFDYFPDLRSEFTLGMNKSQKVIALLDYSERRGMTNHLLTTLDQLRPVAYRERFPPVAPLPPAPAGKLERNPDQVFLCHASQDAKFARKLADDLRENGVDIWIAPDSIVPGEKWVDAINRGLETSGVLVLVITRHAADSKWVRDESAYAIALENRNEMRFITLDVADGRIPPLWSVRQHIPFRQDYDVGLRRLLAVLRPRSAGSPMAEPSDKPVVSPENRSRVAPPLTTAPAGAGKLPAKRSMLVWSWLVGVSALVALVVWTGIAFRGWGGDGQEPGATTAVVEVVATERVAMANVPLTTTVTPAATSTRKPTATPTSLPTSTITPTPEPQAGDIRVVTRGGVEVEQVYVPAGSFMMGSQAGFDNEGPVHEVTLDAFWLDRTEVTNAQYAACVADGACDPPENSSSYSRDSYYLNPEYADYLVIYVRWEDAAAYAEWAGGRLPTEAEWEYAARGPQSFVYPWGNQAITCDLANYWGKNGGCVGDTSKVGDYPDGASWVGALDMAGNVWEWVNDWYNSDYYTRSSGLNPPGPESGEYRALRGGSWSDLDQDTRAAYRYGDDPINGGNDVGFRVAELLSDSDS